jgi:hypothetical protein
MRTLTLGSPVSAEQFLDVVLECRHVLGKRGADVDVHLGLVRHHLPRGAAAQDADVDDPVAGGIGERFQRERRPRRGTHGARAFGMVHRRMRRAARVVRAHRTHRAAADHHAPLGRVGSSTRTAFAPRQASSIQRREPGEPSSSSGTSSTATWAGSARLRRAALHCEPRHREAAFHVAHAGPIGVLAVLVERPVGMAAAGQTVSA